MIDGAEEFRVELGSGRKPVIRRTSFPSTVVGDQVEVVTSIKDRLQVAIREPVEVDDDGDIFGRQRINGIVRIFVR